MESTARETTPATENDPINKGSEDGEASVSAIAPGLKDLSISGEGQQNGGVPGRGVAVTTCSTDDNEVD